MGKLSVYLPPYAPDYSGACSILYPFNSLLIIHDAQGCTSNYTGFDEPRWYGSKKPLYCSGLRKIDVALGNEERTISRIVTAAEELKPEFIAIVGSPVPMVIGTDFEGLAAEIEERTKITTLGLGTTGINLYTEGMGRASKMLLDRFLPEGGHTRKRTVNLLGATPLDFSEEEIEDLKAYLSEGGYSVNYVLSLGYIDKPLAVMADAAVNLVLSQGGVEIAEWFERYFEIPWMAGLPIGEKAKKDFLPMLKKVEDEHIYGHYWGADSIQNEDEDGLLIVNDEIIGASLAYSFFHDEKREKIRLACPFTKKERADVLYPDSEKLLIREINKSYLEIYGDPLILDLIQTGAKKIPYGHFAVSSHFRQNYSYNRLKCPIKY